MKMEICNKEKQLCGAEFLEKELGWINMKGINSEFSKRIPLKDLIEQMREEIAIEKGEKYIKPTDKPKGKPKTPLTPMPKRPKKPKKQNIFALKHHKKQKHAWFGDVAGVPLLLPSQPKMTEKEFIFGLKLYNKTTKGKKNPINIKKKLKEIRGAKK